ncbi:MAG: DNA mismatch repair protein MutS [Muribaculaceae bacterium]|nr:DNA mismatch repair protein MutS [Bacteroidales bacterium]MDY4649303.1 DNA mismatch repair protein MutS [Muribaculaceae bacterium]MDY5388455.1 DNA mismatch repair protein MutS [Muribaculaceae bacterium]
MSKPVETPLMAQYVEMKKKHPDAILLFRVGDFYETFSEDAIAASKILGITLTRRANGKAAYVELAGFPHHALDTYLPRLVRAGRRVAICEQLEDPKLTKKLVKRGITELITPGVNLNDNSLSAKENNFLAAIHVNHQSVGVAFLDISTGEFLCSQGSVEDIDKLLCNIKPKELLRINGLRQWCDDNIHHRCATFDLDDWIFTSDAAEVRLSSQFGTKSLKGFGVDRLPDAVIAAGAVLHYLDITHHTDLRHITGLGRIDSTRFVALDPFTVRNLELVAPLSPDGLSLFDVLNHTSTPMGARRLHNWILFPLLDLKEIARRHDIVDYLFKDPDTRCRALDALQRVGDLLRLITKVGALRISPRDCVALRTSLAATTSLAAILRQSNSEPLHEIAEKMADCSSIISTLEKTLLPDAPAVLGRGAAIAPGVNDQLDELRALHANSRQTLLDMQTRESERTGIPSLKIGFNNVFGYYIEIRNTHKDKVPTEWIRKQTLVSAERYITPELKEYEEKIVNAEENINKIESEIFASLVDGLMRLIPDMQSHASATEYIDCLLSFADVADCNHYVRPVVDDSLVTDICEGRHPVIERRLPAGEPYISNSLTLDCDKTQIMMITGPNMSGKSALLRQTALITLMAQIGSFVPAQSARIGYVDKIFTRVGASDNISSGESTFMIEMNEAAAILNNMSPRSLILFDELGRGTSTYDGISIAWAIVEHIHENAIAHPRTLFATHYHELNEMAASFHRIVNFNVSVREINGKVVFMRKLEPGGSEHSFGIHVARLAGMPPSIVRRADQVLKRLEQASESSSQKPALADLGKARDGYQLSLFQLDDPLLSQIRDRLLGLNIDNLTPIQALTTLHDLQGLLTGKNQ